VSTGLLRSQYGRRAAAQTGSAPSRPKSVLFHFPNEVARFPSRVVAAHLAGAQITVGSELRWYLADSGSASPVRRIGIATPRLAPAGSRGGQAPRERGVSTGTSRPVTNGRPPWCVQTPSRLPATLVLPGLLPVLAEADLEEYQQHGLRQARRTARRWRAARRSGRRRTRRIAAPATTSAAANPNARMRERTALAHALAGWSTGEAARRLGLPRRRTDNALQRAKRKLHGWQERWAA
jgi:hypothetical protein